MVDAQRSEQHARLLSNVELFSGLDRVSLSKLAAHLGSRHLTAGETLLREGEAADCFYLIADGTFGVFVTPKDGLAETRIQTLRAGDPVGEMALLTNSARSATVLAESDGEVLRLGRSKFMQLVRQQPSVPLAIAATLSRRLRDVLAASEASEARAADRAAGAPALPQPADKAMSAVGRVVRALTHSLVLVAVFALLAVLVGWHIAPPAGLSLAGWRALVVLVAFLPALVIDAIPEGIVAIALAAAWVLGGVVSAPVALSGFASPNWVLVVCVLIVGSAVAATGVLYRMALWTVARFPSASEARRSRLASPACS